MIQLKQGDYAASMLDLRVDIGRDFSLTPGGRYRQNGDFSGEEFREDILAPKLQMAIAQGLKVRVAIDTVSRSYQASFLDEAFAGLIRDAHFSKDQVRRFLIIEASDSRFEKYKNLAEYYIDSVP